MYVFDTDTLSLPLDTRTHKLFAYIKHIHTYVPNNIHMGNSYTDKLINDSCTQLIDEL